MRQVGHSGQPCYFFSWPGILKYCLRLCARVCQYLEDAQNCWCLAGPLECPLAGWLNCFDAFELNLNLHPETLFRCSLLCTQTQSCLVDYCLLAGACKHYHCQHCLAAAALACFQTAASRCCTEGLEQTWQRSWMMCLVRSYLDPSPLMTCLAPGVPWSYLFGTSPCWDAGVPYNYCFVGTRSCQVFGMP